mgnify:CR=1 FL=1
MTKAFNDMTKAFNDMTKAFRVDLIVSKFRNVRD